MLWCLRQQLNCGENESFLGTGKKKGELEGEFKNGDTVQHCASLVVGGRYSCGEQPQWIQSRLVAFYINF